LRTHRQTVGIATLLVALLLQLAGAGCSADAAAGGEVAKRIGQVLAEAYPPGEPGAAVIVARNGQIVHEQGFGLANLEHDVPVTPQTVFRLASVTKLFTATAMLMLVDEGKLALDDDLRKHLPGYPAAASPISVGDLLAHTSGLAEYLDRPDNMQFVRAELTPQELIDSFKERDPRFAPGTSYAYGNSDYILLGAIVEKLSGVPYGEFLRTRIFEPAGMRHSHYDASREIVPGRAAPYEPLRRGEEQDWSEFRNARFYTMSAVYAAGGCLSSAEDLLLFHRALAAGKLVEPETLQAGFRPARLRDGSSAAGAAGGWQLDRVEGRRAAMFGGALPGVCTWYLELPDDGLVVILLSNRSPGQPRCGRLAVELAGIVVRAE
jgi:CubicO group peptidase (beta-lactamase class C family)